MTRSLMLARCDRGAEIALLLGLEHETAEAIRALDEHWDGNGQPHGLRGEEIPLLARIVCLAQTAEIFHGEGGADAACAVAAAPQRRVVRPRRSSTRCARAATTRASGPRLGRADVVGAGSPRTGC